MASAEFVRQPSPAWHQKVPGARWFRADLHRHTLDDDRCRWLQEAYERGRLGVYLRPPLTEGERAMAELEGWTMGTA